MRSILPLTFCLFGVALYGQRPPQQTPPPQEQQTQQPPVTLTGCLTKGAQQGEYVIADSKSGEKYTFAGPDRLDQYVNHTVELTGKMMTSGGEKSFQPQSIKTVSTSCQGSLR